MLVDRLSNDGTLPCSLTPISSLKARAVDRQGRLRSPSTLARRPTKGSPMNAPRSLLATAAVIAGVGEAAMTVDFALDNDPAGYVTAGLFALAFLALAGAVEAGRRWPAIGLAVLFAIEIAFAPLATPVRRLRTGRSSSASSSGLRRRVACRDRRSWTRWRSAAGDVSAQSERSSGIRLNLCRVRCRFASPPDARAQGLQLVPPGRESHLGGTRSRAGSPATSWILEAANRISLQDRCDAGSVIGANATISGIADGTTMPAGAGSSSRR